MQFEVGEPQPRQQILTLSMQHQTVTEWAHNSGTRLIDVIFLWGKGLNERETVADAGRLCFNPLNY